MADPTLLRDDSPEGTRYYCTGTSEAALTANFCIYVSTDLISWQPHDVAFPECSPGEPGELPGGMLLQAQSWPGTTPCSRAGSMTQSSVLDWSFSVSTPLGGDAYSFPPREPGGSAETYQDLWAPHLFRVPTPQNGVHQTYLDHTFGSTPDRVYICSSAVRLSPLLTPRDQPKVFLSYARLSEFRKPHFDPTKDRRPGYGCFRGRSARPRPAWLR